MKFTALSLLVLSGLAHAHPPADGADEAHDEAKQTTHAVAPIMGALAKADIDSVVSANQHRIKDCFQRGLQTDPDISGWVQVKMVIGTTGTVTKSEVQNTTLNHAETEACMLDVVKSLQFPEPEGGGIVIVTYPFVLAHN
jgi:hypothetical protein